MTVIRLFLALFLGLCATTLAQAGPITCIKSYVADPPTGQAIAADDGVRILTDIASTIGLQGTQVTVISCSEVTMAMALFSDGSQAAKAEYVI